MISAIRPLGCETEYGITAENLGNDPVHWSIQLLRDFAAVTELPLVEWDYLSESPLRDLRGFTITRQEADASQLTDDPYHFAPSGPGRPGFTRQVTHTQSRSAFSEAAPQSTSFVLPNGGRFYVDHAHPEYATPECLGPWAGMIADHLADKLARQALAASRVPMALYRNNTDGKGASYGHHENYLVARRVPFSELVQVLTPFFLTRIIICGAGRVGIGASGEATTAAGGFQISTRADYLETPLGLQTTFNRPIINTRDEPHAEQSQWRRLHVIVGDANRYPSASFMKLGMTSLLLSLAEAAFQESASPQIREIWQELTQLNFAADPVPLAKLISQDLDYKQEYRLRNGEKLSALAIQSRFYQLCYRALQLELAAAQSLPSRELSQPPTPVAKTNLLDENAQELIRAGADWETALVLSLWKRYLEAFSQPDTATARDFLLGHCEWYGKYYLAEQSRQRLGSDWTDIRLKALDLQWTKITGPQELSLATSLRQNLQQQDGLTGNIAESYALTDSAYTGSRAAWRAQAVQNQIALPQKTGGNKAHADMTRLDKNRLDKNRLDKNRLDKNRLDTILDDKAQPNELSHDSIPRLVRASWTSLIYQLGTETEIRADLGDLDWQEDYGEKLGAFLEQALAGETSRENPLEESLLGRRLGKLARL